MLLASTPVSVADEHPEGCGEASFLSPDDGQVTVNTQLGNVNPGTGAPVPGIFVSTTGFIDVEIEYHCLHFLHLEVFKVEAVGEPSLIHNEFFDTTCGEGIVTAEVEIGLDAGEYEFTLYWRDCEDVEGGDGRRPVGVDPPLPLGRITGF